MIVVKFCYQFFFCKKSLFDTLEGSQYENSAEQRELLIR